MKLAYSRRNNVFTKEKFDVQLTPFKTDDKKIKYSFMFSNFNFDSGEIVIKQLKTLIHRLENQVKENLDYGFKLKQLLIENGYEIKKSTYVKSHHNFQFFINVDENIKFIAISINVKIVDDIPHLIFHQSRNKTKTLPQTLLKIIQEQENLWDIRTFQLITIETFLISKKSGFTICQCWLQHNQSFAFGRMDMIHCGLFTRRDDVMDIDTSLTNGSFKITSVDKSELRYLRKIKCSNVHDFNQSLQSCLLEFSMIEHKQTQSFGITR